MKIELSRIDVNYEVYGEGRPIVLLHGYWTDLRAIKGPIEPLFAERPGWKRYYLDLPGMGYTPGKPWIKNSDHMLDVVCEFIRTLIPGQKFVIGGYSYGGYLARGVISRWPDLVEGLLLVCPVVIGTIQERTRPKKNILVKDPELMAELSPEEAEEFEGWVAVQSRETYARVEEEVHTGSRRADEPFLTRIQQQDYAFTFDVDEAIGEFSEPTLILAGRQDWIVGYQDAWRILERFPRATFVVLDRAGHALPFVQEQLFDQLVLEWLDRVQESSE